MRLHPRLDAGLLAASSAAACLAAGYATILQPAGAQTWSASFGVVVALGLFAGARLQTVGEQAVREGRATAEWNSMCCALLAGASRGPAFRLTFFMFMTLLNATTAAVCLIRQLSLRTQGAP